MIAPALAIAASMQTIPAMPEHSLSMATGKPLMPYLACLFDPLTKPGQTVPGAVAARERLVTSLLQTCTAVRVDARRAAREAAKTDADRAEIDRTLTAADDRLRFVVVHHEQAVAADASFCRTRGEEPGC
ncbi:hypothetical protein SAMN05216382_0532 [Sphingomonas palmae]|uniref:Uncharacterized protein n=2 Tax=Sphingomonas palmae TaxID=1855283 RepID=A0A1H7HMW1_9SPHN|nr:hypothetical protein SAMN05216382_0532 [Sphingomonas palmae]